MLDLPTPPLPEAMPMTVVRLPSWNGEGRPAPAPPRPARMARRSSSVMASIVTCTPATPSRPERAWVTRRWISAFSGQPATVRRMATRTRPSSTATSPTIPRSTMLRCSSGSWTSRRAVIAASWVSALT